MTQWRIDGAPFVRWSPLMIAFILIAAATDPLLIEIKERGAPPPRLCPYEIHIQGTSGDEEITQHLIYDPSTEEVTEVDESGDPIVPDEPTEDGEGTSISVEGSSYDNLFEYLDLPFERVEGTTDPVKFSALRLPKGTVTVGDADISRRASIHWEVSNGESGPYVSSHRTQLERPVRVQLIARILSFTQHTQFAEIDGHPRVVNEDLSGQFSALGNKQEFGLSLSYNYPACDDDAL